MLTSVLESNRHDRLVIHILTDGFSDGDMNRFLCLPDKYNCEIDVIHIPQEKLAELPEKIGQWPRAICFRLLAPDLLPHDIDRVIYLDCDIIVDTPLRPLWETDLDGMACGAVTEEEGHNSDLMIGVLNVVHNLDPRQRYFNSGVMVMDLSAIRSQGLHTKALDLIKRLGERLSCPDQDALNIVMRHRWMPLPLRWNVQSRFFVKCFFKLLHDPERIMIREIAAKRTRGIIHYTGCKHPWNRDSFLFHPLWYLWDKSLRRSMWRKTCPISRPDSWRQRMAIRKLKLLRRLGISSSYDSLWIPTAHLLPWKLCKRSCRWSA